MSRSFILILFCLFIVKTLVAQITVDQAQLSDALKEKLMEEISGKITSSVQSGEKWVADATYFSVVLEPFEAFGIDPTDPNFINQANDIHKNILAELEKNPGLKYSSQLNAEIRGLVKNGLWNYASSYIDKDSKEIYSQVSDLISNGKEQITKLMDAASGISYLDPGNENYESQVTTVLTNYGIKSDYFFIIDDLDQILSQGYDKIAEPLSALTTVVSAVRSNDPVYKIEMLLELGESFGGKVPIIGNLITPIFTLGKGVLDAAKGLENVLERNLNQGCISPGGGTYGSVNENKRTLFIKQFPYVGRACPMNQDVYSPVYNNIYVNTSDQTELFFYTNSKWLKGEKDKLHKGTTDIFSAVQWLREHENSEKATDLNFMISCYQKEYGWSSYTDEVYSRINRIRTLFLSAYQTANYCENESLKDFFMSKMGLNWIERLLNMGDAQFDWNDLKKINPELEKNIADQMIKNYYLSKHQPNLINLDRIIKNLSQNTPININGRIAEGNGAPISGASLQASGNEMFESAINCQNLVSSGSGSFSFFILLPVDKISNVTISASLPDGKSLAENLIVEPINRRAYTVNFFTPYEEPDSNASNSDDTSDSGDSGEDEPDIPNCANDPFAVAEWDPVNEKYYCACVDNFIWDEGQQKCVKDIQTIIDNSSCNQWENTEAKWDYTADEPYCDCVSGYEWNENYTKCISLQEKMVSQTDCSQYGNARAVWDPVNNEVACECLPGYEWDKNYTKCISIALAGMQNYDCSGYPNTEVVWDPVSEQAWCDCLPGYEWNDDFTGCEPPLQQQPQQPVQYDCSHLPNSRPVFDQVLNEMVCDCMPGFEWNRDFTACVPVRNKPNIDWGNIISMTNDILNGINAGNSGMFPTGAGSLTPGTSMQQPVQHQSNCNDQQQAGANTPEVHNIDLGQSFGSFMFDYETFTAKDQIVITNGGRTIFNSGCVGERKSIQLNLSGFSPTISVRVNPNCDGGSSTQWNFTVHCPGN